LPPESFIAEVESVADYLDSGARGDEFHGHHVKARGYIEEFLLIQINQSDFGELALLPLVDCGRRPSEVFCRPGFNLNED
jgi:hypothetical protein